MDHGWQFTQDPCRCPSQSASPCPFTPRGLHLTCHRSQSREKSPCCSYSHEGKQCWPFWNGKSLFVCPKCLGWHKDFPNHPICNLSSLLDNSGPAYYTLLCGLCNQIPSSAHSSVVRGHVEFLRASLKGDSKQRPTGPELLLLSRSGFLQRGVTAKAMSLGETLVEQLSKKGCCSWRVIT